MKAGMKPAGSSPATLTMAACLNRALGDAMALDEKVLVMGEDVGTLGGVFTVSDGLLDRFGERRVIDTPIAEAGIVGTAIGLAMRGFRPVCEIQFDAFVFPAFDQITNQLAKIHSRSGGRTPMPVVIRIPFGGGIGAVEHHSESPEALFTHTAGLMVATPATPGDAYWMLREAIACPDPVVFFEPKARYWDAASVDLPEASAASPDTAYPHLTTARVARPGEDLTLAAYGPCLHTALQAASLSGADIEVLDLRSLSPLDVDTLTASVERTGRLVIVHEAPVFGGFGAEIAARVQERCFFHLQAPILRVGGYHMPYPPARVERDYLPGVGRVCRAIEESLAT